MRALCDPSSQLSTYVVDKNGHPYDTCYDAIGLCAQNVEIILGSIVNTIGKGPCDDLERERERESPL